MADTVPRQARLEIPGVPLHVVQRGVNRCATLLDDDDRHHYLQLLAEAARTQGMALHAYVLMTNHVQLLVSCPFTGGIISRAMRQIGQSYVAAFNRKHRRTGTLGEGRFKLGLVDSEAYVLTAYRYIELNPVRAAMTTSAADYPWSSAGANLGLVTSPMLKPHPAYVALSADPCERTTSYGAWLHAGIDCEQPSLFIRHSVPAPDTISTRQRSAACRKTPKSIRWLSNESVDFLRNCQLLISHVCHRKRRRSLLGSWSMRQR